MSVPIMDNANRNHTPINGGHAAERQPLLPSPLSVNGHPDADTTVDAERVAVDGSGFNTLQQSRLKLGASTLNFFLSGIAMAAVGFERHYSINDAQAALVFPAGVFGYLVATATTSRIQMKKGRRGVAFVSSASRLLFALVLSSAPDFSLLLVSFAGFGYGTGLTDTAWNSWASSTAQPNIIQGILHGSFSVGCVAGPALATVVLRKAAWSLLYRLLACALFIELVVQTWAFRSDTGTNPSTEITSRGNAKTQSLLRNHSLWLCGAYYLVYQGVEASFTDWIVLFLVRTRHADTATAASASSIFWLGMAIGRYALGTVTERVGLRTSVSSYIVVACCAQLCLMILEQIPGTLTMLGVCGFFLAPLFPSGIVMLSTRNPSEDRTKIVAAVIAMGQIGGAVVPYGLGLLATHLGTRYLLDVTLGLSVLLLGLWAAISRLEVSPVTEESSD